MQARHPLHDVRLVVTDLAPSACPSRSVGGGVNTVETIDKRASTAKARAAMLGIVVHVLQGDDGRPEWIATRWALTKSFRDLAEFEGWLDRVDGRRAEPEGTPA